MAINLSTVEAKEGNKFEPLPEGVYYLRITKGIESDKDGKIQHELEFTVQTGPYALRKFHHWFIMTEKMTPYVKHFYGVVGASDFSAIDPSDFVGKPLMAEVIIDEYNGKKNNKLGLGLYYKWDGKDPAEKNDVPPKGAATVVKPAAKKVSPFSNATAPAAASSDEPPF